ncbi:NAD(P)-binding protein [Basidiobolus meristosporus CBS 931.73]|uniref:NAD(P)-binding protein n=1 Tax=Basidiobolus meristosporus CBS 931.73 TaxID=1314790 RepID=A0A1Y1YW76_9FUNG|nr:NAD(P)-binding protein [Basidiobolus meristosporus CBS 931.73]|eukprot:ORY02094.1 NAD(P)-binding protein [Basidiobolus meristosporus CBS 931.73]
MMLIKPQYIARHALGSTRHFTTSRPSPAKQKVVVFGGNGFLGKYVARGFIQDADTTVQLVGRTKNDALRHLGNQILPSVSVDILDRQAIMEATQEANVVVNLVGIMHEKKPKYTFDNVQHLGARNIALAAKEAGARLVHVSAIGANPDSTIPYAKSKGLGEIAVHDTLPESVILRPSLVFGPEDDFFNRFSKLAKILPFVPVFGGGKTKFQPVYVWDVAKAVVKCATDKSVSGRIVELGGPKVYTYREMMQLCLDQAGTKRPILSLPWAVGMVQGFFLEKLPLNLFTLTQDQVRLLRHDNIVSGTELSLTDLGIKATPAERILYTYLRAHGLTSKNKRTHRMIQPSIEDELRQIQEIRKQTPPNLEKELEHMMNPRPRKRV